MDSQQDKSYVVGVLYALTTSFFWDLLPALLELALQTFSAGTIVWFRFTFAFLILFAILQWKRQEPQAILRRPPFAGILAGGALAVNYLYFLLGVQANGPTNAAICMQVAPVLVVLIGILVFKEWLLRHQRVGLCIAAAGFIFFYRDKLSFAVDTELYATGNYYLYFAAAIWALFASLLKLLSGRYEAQQLNLLIYGIAGLLLTGGVHWEEFVHVNFKHWVLLTILGVNTLIAYGALSEAIRHIPLSLTTVITTTNPLFTLLTVFWVNTFQPLWLRQDQTGVSGYCGALLICAGVALVVYKPGQKYR